MAYRNDGMSAHALANGLGWFSIGLGLAEVAAPGALTRTLGLEGHERLVQAYGAREIANGIGILTARDPAPWIWGRVAGDALDIATVMTGLDDDNPKRGNIWLALGGLAAVTAVDVLCVQGLRREESQFVPPVRDYSDRSGLPRPPSAMRGAASDFQLPKDMRTPEAMEYHPST